MRRKRSETKFVRGEEVLVQRKPNADWERAEYERPYTDWPGMHRIFLKRARWINSMNGEETDYQDPNGFLTTRVSAPTRRIRKITAAR